MGYRCAQELRAIDAALASLRAADAQNEADWRTARAQSFHAGPPGPLPCPSFRAEQDALGRLRERVALARRTVASLEAELDPDNEREQITTPRDHLAGHDALARPASA